MLEDIAIQWGHFWRSGSWCNWFYNKCKGSGKTWCKSNLYFYFMELICKVGRIAYENVVIELLIAKCLPSPYYRLDACPINISQIKLLDFVLNSVFRKIFLIKPYDVASECITFFDCSVSKKQNYSTRKTLQTVWKIYHWQTGYCTRTFV